MSNLNKMIINECFNQFFYILKKLINLTFKIKPSEALLVQGKNGAGKSSLLKILAGLWRPGAGTLLWQDQTLNIKDPNFLSQVLYLGHKLGIQPALTVIQNLQWLLEKHLPILPVLSIKILPTQ